MVLSEAHHVPLVSQISAQVLANRPRRPLDQPVVQPLVVGVVEALGQQFPFHVPIDLGQEQEIGVLLLDSGDDHLPELSFRDGAGALAPRLGEDATGDQHGHVAAQAIALPGDLQQSRGGTVARGGAENVDLRGVRPGGEVWVAPVREDAPLRPGKEYLWMLHQVAACALQQAVRCGEQPIMVAGHVIGHKVEDQLQPALGQARPQRRQRIRPAQAGINRVLAHGVGRPDDILGREIGQGAAAFSQQAALGQGLLPPGGAALPDAHQPHRVEAPGGQRVERLVGHGAQCDRFLPGGAQAVQPRPGVDLVDQRAGLPGGRGHGQDTSLLGFDIQHR